MQEPAESMLSAYCPPGFRHHTRRILYIGKATRGHISHAKLGKYFNGPSMFWTFARQISKLADPKCKDLSNVAWSNLFKQGVTQGNPRQKFAGQQKPAAIEQLRKEAKDLKPSLIVLVNAYYYEDVSRSAFYMPEGSEKACGSELWFRPRFRGIAPILWMCHPQFKKRAYLEAALSVIESELGWKREKT
jgi:hypothetical protein